MSTKSPHKCLKLLFKTVNSTCIFNVPGQGVFFLWTTLGTVNIPILFVLCVLQEVQGWYYLLGEELGRKKHLKVPTQHDYHSTGKWN